MKIIVQKKGEHYRIWIQNEMRARLLLDDKAHMGLTLRTEVSSRIDVLRVAFALPRESVVWECDEVPALA